jgi:heptosyltransferase-2
LQQVKKILIIQTAFLGDVILTTPLVYSLKQIFPFCSIDFLTIPKSVNILENNPDIDEIIIFDKGGQDRGLTGLRRMGKNIGSREYDLCITPHRSLRSAYLSYASGAKIRIGFDRSAFKWVFTSIVKYRNELHEIERNLSLLASFDQNLKISRPLVYPTEEDKNIINQLIKDNNLNQKSRIFALAPGSIWPTKRWPETYFVKMCSMLVVDGYFPVLIGGPDDVDLCAGIVKKCPGVISLAGSITLRQSKYFLSKCTALLTNDSAPLHLGLAAGIPVNAIFGATIPEFGFAPFGEKDKIIEYKDLACRPCGIHGGKKCPIKTFDCMIKLTPGLVYDKIEFSNL